MWFWLIFAALVNKNLQISMAEPLGTDVQENIPDDSMYLYMEERSLKDPKPETDDIEARRRSPLDMNFMRFGRRDNLFPLNHYYDLKETDYNDDFSRPLNFVRSRRDSKDPKRGKGKDYSNFVRFGRSFYENLAKDPRVRDYNFGKRRDYTDFIRFGRNPLRDINDIYRENKRHTNTMRFGKKSTGFMRFG